MKNKNIEKPRNIELTVRHPREARPVPIIADAAISTVGLHGGRILPLVLLDTTDRPDVAEFIRVHNFLGPGDVAMNWDNLDGRELEGKIALFLTFIRPIELYMIIEFDIVEQGVLVQSVLSGKGIYLAQADDSYDRFIHNIGRPSVIVEIPDLGFQEAFDQMLQKQLSQHFRKQGLSRSDARRATNSAIEKLHEISDFRMDDARGLCDVRQASAKIAE